MRRLHCVTSAVLAAAVFLGLFHTNAQAEEIYKWTDANGKVHYGDRFAAPDSSKKMHITVAPPSLPPAAPASATTSPRRAPLLAQRDSSKKSVPANPALVGPRCKSLIDQIAAVPPGKNWELLYRQFDSTCPGIAYECVKYQSNPQNNQCIWIERSGSRVLSTNIYP